MKPDLQKAIDHAISEHTGHPFQTQDVRVASGGCIHQSYIIRAPSSRYFVKVNAASNSDVFEAEADCLEAIHQTAAIACPRPLICEKLAGQSVLIMETLAFGAPSGNSWERMGKGLAAMHRHTNDRHGWHRDNYIGATPQFNDWTESWADFFCQQRLQPQFHMARKNGYKFQHEADLLEAAHELLSKNQPEASLLHGDLWSGNAGFLDDGTAVIYDPASYYGDRETDLAFSEFFGGFPSAFYHAYQAEWPLEPGYEQRKVLYNLYHVLNHANLFGGGYASQAEGMIRQILSMCTR